MTSVSDDELIARLEDLTLPEDSFHHADHLRAAFLYLRRYPVFEALQRFSAALRQFASSRGKPDRYHETITWAYMFLVRERSGDAEETWEEFAGANPDLLDWQNSILKRYYREATLSSDPARKHFLLPDKNL